jgi:hypothetical protein
MKRDAWYGPWDAWLLILIYSALLAGVVWMARAM